MLHPHTTWCEALSHPLRAAKPFLTKCEKCVYFQAAKTTCIAGSAASCLKLYGSPEQDQVQGTFRDTDSHCTCPGKDKAIPLPSLALFFAISSLMAHIHTNWCETLPQAISMNPVANGSVLDTKVAETYTPYPPLAKCRSDASAAHDLVRSTLPPSS